MSRVRNRDTKPEMMVRSALHSMGFRFRLHRRDLPGTPDIVLPRHRKVVLVHGCFWHGHDCKQGSRVPKTNRDFWVAKIARNVQRDRANIAALEALGWGVCVIWECELRQPEALIRHLTEFLRPEE